MKKLVLTTLAACVSMAFASAYAESTTSKEPIRLAQAPKSGDDPANVPAQRPKDRKVREGSGGKSEAKSGDDPTNVPAQKPKDRKVREGSGGKTPAAKSGDEGSSPTGSTKARKSRSGEGAEKPEAETKKCQSRQRHDKGHVTPFFGDIRQLFRQPIRGAKRERIAFFVCDYCCAPMSCSEPI